MEFAFLEKKFVQMAKGSRAEITEKVAFNEGNLALGTALLLRDSLEKLGAEVLVTRNQEAHTSFGGTYDDWLMGELKRASAASDIDFTEIKGTGEYGYAIRLRRAAGWNWLREKELTGADSLW